MAMPDWIQPMAATLTERRFTGAEWVFERKFDGIRLVAFKQDAEVRLYSRNRLPQHIPGVEAAVRALPVSELILDGEVTWDRESAFHVFDVMWMDGTDLTHVPLDERQALLRTLSLAPPLHPVEPLAGPAPWADACRLGWEGVIAKRRDSIYEQRRSPHWLKMKCELEADLVVGGFTDPQGGRRGLGALLVGHYVAGDFVFAGRVGTGFDMKLLIALREQLEALEITTSPFTKAKGLPRTHAHWVRPEMVVRVAFIEWTVHGKLRHSRLLEVLG